MRERSIIIICIVAILCVTAASATVILWHDNNQTNNTTNNSTVNVTLNETQNNTTTNNTTTKTTTSTKKSSTKNYDPDYDPARDKSHQGATKDNPITVQQSDGEYTYYGPGHYDYYAGDNHMSGGYYKEMNNRKY